jgi:hypothetical protein
VSTTQHNNGEREVKDYRALETQLNEIQRNVAVLALQLNRIQGNCRLDRLEELVRRNPNTPLRFTDIERSFGFPSRSTLWRWAKIGRLRVNPRVPGRTTAQWLWDAIDGRQLPR